MAAPWRRRGSRTRAEAGRHGRASAFSAFALARCSHPIRQRRRPDAIGQPDCRLNDEIEDFSRLQQHMKRSRMQQAVSSMKMTSGPGSLDE